MTTTELMAIDDDEKFVEALRDHGFPADASAELDEAFAMKIQELMRFEICVACDGFSSLYDQIVRPGEWPDYERLLEDAGAFRYAKLLRGAREIYFGKKPLPSTNEEWISFRSPIWTEPEGYESRRFDKVADEAEEAFYSDQVTQKLGAYIRRHWHLLNPKCEN